MSFRKRSTVINTSASTRAAPAKAETTIVPGVRPSPLDGRATTSTGTASLDNLLAGHAGLPLGTSLFIEEHGTTDFAGVLCRYYAAEGLVQGHQVHVLGLSNSWRADLPGITLEASSSSKSEASAGDKMKIAWRYEALSSPSASRGYYLIPAVVHELMAYKIHIDRESASGAFQSASTNVFCHTFDLTKKLAPADVTGSIGFHPSVDMTAMLGNSKDETSRFKAFLKDVDQKVSNSPPEWIHRIMVPNMLSPTLYSSSQCRPEGVLQFLHGLRALLRRHSTKLVAVVTLPVSLYPRSSGLTRWMELLSDGVLEFVPLQLNAVHAPPPSGKSDTKSEEQTQGLLRWHSLPIFHERGGGGSDGHAREDMSFSLSRTKGLIIKPFSLPPLMEDEPEKPPGEATKANIDF